VKVIKWAFGLVILLFLILILQKIIKYYHSNSFVFNDENLGMCDWQFEHQKFIVESKYFKDSSLSLCLEIVDFGELKAPDSIMVEVFHTISEPVVIYCGPISKLPCLIHFPKKFLKGYGLNLKIKHKDHAHFKNGKEPSYASLKSTKLVLYPGNKDYWVIE
jgi:hypothetical protein